MLHSIRICIVLITKTIHIGCFGSESKNQQHKCCFGHEDRKQEKQLILKTN